MPTVEIPVYYEANVREKGHRTWCNRSFRATGHFDLPEIDPGDCPVAATGLPGGNIRWDGEKFWIADRAPELDGGIVAWAEGLVSCDGHSHAWQKFIEVRLGKIKPGHEIMIDELNDYLFRDKKNDTLSEDVARTVDFISRMALIDGVVHRQCPRPAFRITKTNSRTPPTVAIVRGLPTKAEFETFFSLDRQSDMMMFLEGINGQSEGIHEPSILLPEAFRFKDEEFSLLVASDSICRMTKSWLDGMDDETGEAWFRMRAASRALEKDIDDVDAAALLAERIEDLLSTLPDHDVSDSYAFRGTYWPAKKALERWNARPIEIGFSFHR